MTIKNVNVDAYDESVIKKHVEVLKASGQRASIKSVLEAAVEAFAAELRKEYDGWSVDSPTHIGRGYPLRGRTVDGQVVAPVYFMGKLGWENEDGTRVKVTMWSQPDTVAVVPPPPVQPEIKWRTDEPEVCPNDYIVTGLTVKYENGNIETGVSGFKFPGGPFTWGNERKGIIAWRT